MSDPPVAQGSKGISSLAELPGEFLAVLFSAEPYNAPIRSQPQVEWTAIAAEAAKHGIGLLLYQRLIEMGLADYLDAGTAGAWQADARHSLLQCNIQRSDAIEISDEFQRCKIPHAFLKGFVFRELWYRPTWVRPASDLDILVHPSDTERARAAMFRIGFDHATRTWDFREFRPATEEEIRRVEKTHHELAQFARSCRLSNPPDWLFQPEFARGAPFTFEKLQQGPVFHSVVDIHWALHLAFVDESPLDDLTWVPCATGSPIPMLSHDWQLLFLIFKLYFEAFDEPRKGLHKLIDLAALLKNAAKSEIDWNWIDLAIERYQFEAAAFYTLSAAERITGEQLLPHDFLSKYRRMKPRTKGVSKDEFPDLDYGDFLPSVFGRRISANFPPRP